MAWWIRSKSPSSGVLELVNQCKENVHEIKRLSRVGNLHNKQQCQDLFTKLSETIENVQGLVSLCESASTSNLRPALEGLYRCLEKAKVLVKNCDGGEDWSAAAVFQMQNENAFREILLEVGFCYNAIYEQAKSCKRTKLEGHPDLREPSTGTFDPANPSRIYKDQQEIRKRLKDLVNQPRTLVYLDQFQEAKNSVERCRAEYLLRILDHSSSEQSQKHTSNASSAIVLTTESDLPLWAWGSSHLLGSGSGASGVMRTSWLGIPCAKKEFHDPDKVPAFKEEARILAGLKHPRIVQFICCGDGQKKGDRFIAMELMQKSLRDLIKEQKDKNKPFSLSVAVDMIVQMARGMLYLHDQAVAHRDLKPGNVVVNTVTFPQEYRLEDYFCVKLVDFGLSKTEAVDDTVTASEDGIGTTYYRAPELHSSIKHQRAIWFKADVYSFAITCAHVLSLKQPFEGIRLAELYNELKRGTRPKLPKDSPQELDSLIKECWSFNARSRPGFKEICTRLEKLQHKVLRGNLELEMNHLTDGFAFIKAKMEKESSNKFVDEIAHVVGEASETSTIEKKEISEDGMVAIITCTCNHALVPLESSAYPKKFNCNMCRKPGTGKVYHCETCNFDAHPYCAEIEKKVDSVFFHEYPLRIRKHDDSNLDVMCDFCQEPLRKGEWVYKSKQGSFLVHALCAKYPKEMVHLKHPEEQEQRSGRNHPLNLINSATSATRKICKCCSEDIKGYHYTCTWCSFDLHPFCATHPTEPTCIFRTGHRLSLVTEEMLWFRCGECKTSGASWFYHCDTCNVNIHLNCVIQRLKLGSGNDDADIAFQNLCVESPSS